VDALFAEAAAREGRNRHSRQQCGDRDPAPAVELSLDDWNKVVAVNMTGMFLCARSRRGI